jgi:hypothetical protein
MEQRYQDLALLAVSKLAEQSPDLAYIIGWKDKALLIKPSNTANGHVVVTSDGVSGDATLAELIEKNDYSRRERQ